MHEKEIKILEIDVETVTKKLETFGAEKIFEGITMMEGYDLPSESLPFEFNETTLPSKDLLPIFEHVRNITEGKYSLMSKRAYLRLRREGERRELILKQLVHAAPVKEELELSIEIPDESQWDAVASYMESIGLKKIVYQQKKRISYLYNNIRFDIDTWPSVPTYLEIESNTEEAILDGVRLMGFDPKDTTSMTGKEVFEKYSVDPNHLVFENRSN
ncbi:MAG: hypothetical protein UT33_C0002G0003 [Candidatus Peregrinibacteria bacterium GW2011_GWC2_39_14]|nr:MAG: hypothetical protein UT33_C0002G0003 [Candidatus Peregrinibacteria bacterium GW2011_GWC2_39_14]